MKRVQSGALIFATATAACSLLLLSVAYVVVWHNNSPASHKWRWEQKCISAPSEIDDFGEPMWLYRTDVADVYVASPASAMDWRSAKGQDGTLWIHAVRTGLYDDQTHAVRAKRDGGSIVIKQNLAIWEVEEGQRDSHCSMIRPWEAEATVLGENLRYVLPSVGPYHGNGLLVREKEGTFTVRTEAGELPVANTLFDVPPDKGYVTWAVIDHKDGLNISLNLTTGEDDGRRYLDIIKPWTDLRSDDEGVFVWIVERSDGQKCIRRWRDEIFCADNIVSAKVRYADDQDPEADRYLTFISENEDGVATNHWYSHHDGYHQTPYTGTPL